MYFLVDVDRQRVPTVSRKSERLVNLTIALLATKRWITKSEIFATIDGYEGEIESKERMFERDKDDLRNLGIDIEVGSFDPLFEDEAGYRIRPDKYRVQLDGLNPQQLSLLSLAAQIWQGAALGDKALSATTKLKSLGIDSDIDSLGLSPSLVVSDSAQIPALIEAISSKRVISFGYISPEFEIDERSVECYGLISRKSLWYLVGKDRDKGAIRTFRLDRIVEEIRTIGKDRAYEIPEDFSLGHVLDVEGKEQLGTLLIRKDRGSDLRLRAKSIIDKGDWDQIDIDFLHQDSMVREILWHLDDVRVVAPLELREKVIGSLSEIAKAHG
jgi:proteasome accessory factor B